MERYKPARITELELHRHPNGKYSIIEYRRMSNETFVRKRTLHKGLSYSEAEERIYELERRKNSR